MIPNGQSSPACPDSRRGFLLVFNASPEAKRICVFSRPCTIMQETVLKKGGGRMEQFARTERLIGRAALARLSQCRVAVFGLGGVGGMAAEALARSGVGTLALFDHDRVSLTNLNRQVIALHSTLGQHKTEAMARRLLDINPALRLELFPLFYLPETAAQVDLSSYDYIVDAVDTVTAKLTLAQEAGRAGVPIISALGAGNRLDPSLLRIGDLYETAVCPLARVMRKAARQRGIERLTVAYSLEPPLVPEESREAPSAGLPRRDTPASASFVPPAMGLLIASRVVRDLIGMESR